MLMNLWRLIHQVKSRYEPNQMLIGPKCTLVLIRDLYLRLNWKFVLRQLWQVRRRRQRSPGRRSRIRSRWQLRLLPACHPGVARHIHQRQLARHHLQGLLYNHHSAHISTGTIITNLSNSCRAKIVKNNQQQNFLS